MKRRTFKSLTSESLVEGRVSSLDPRSLSCCWSFWLAILESNRSSAAAHLRKNWVQKWSFCSRLASFRCWLKGGERVFLFTFYFFFFFQFIYGARKRNKRRRRRRAHNFAHCTLYVHIYTSQFYPKFKSAEIKGKKKRKTTTGISNNRSLADCLFSLCFVYDFSDLYLVFILLPIHPPVRFLCSPPRLPKFSLS